MNEKTVPIVDRSRVGDRSGSGIHDKDTVAILRNRNQIFHELSSVSGVPSFHPNEISANTYCDY